MDIATGSGPFFAHISILFSEVPPKNSNTPLVQLKYTLYINHKYEVVVYYSR